MLVLSRDREGQIVLRTPEGRKIVLTVCDFPRSNRVRLGFDADREVEIDRLEIDKLKHPSDYPADEAKVGLGAFIRR